MECKRTCYIYNSHKCNNMQQMEQLLDAHLQSDSSLAVATSNSWTSISDHETVFKVSMHYTRKCQLCQDHQLRELSLYVKQFISGIGKYTLYSQFAEQCKCLHTTVHGISEVPVPVPARSRSHALTAHHIWLWHTSTLPSIAVSPPAKMYVSFSTTRVIRSAHYYDT